MTSVVTAVGPAVGFGILLRMLSGFTSYKPDTTHPARTLRGVNATFWARLWRQVKSQMRIRILPLALPIVLGLNTSFSQFNMGLKWCSHCQTMHNTVYG